MKSKIICGSALLGLIIGAFCVPTWSAGVESAEVLSGLVRLPLENPNYMYHTGVYSFWCIQLPALLLKIGISPWAVSMMSSGLECATAFAAVTSCALIFFESAVIAVLCPLLFTFMLHPNEHGYPVLFLPSIHHFGQMGMFAALLSVSLIALGYRPVGLLLLGLLPSVHASIALMAWVVVFSGLLPEYKDIWSRRRQYLVPFAFGVSFTTLTLFAQKIFVSQSTIPVDSKVAEELLRAFTTFWDPHRQPMKWQNLRVDLCMLIYAFYRLYFCKKEILKGERFFWTGVTGMTLVAGTYCVAYNLFPQHFEDSILNTLMVRRWLNLNTMLLPLLTLVLLGKLSFERRSLLATSALVAVVLLVLFSPPTTLNMEDRQLLLQHWKGGHWGSLFIDAFYYKRLYMEAGLFFALLLFSMKRIDKVYEPSWRRPLILFFAAFVVGISGWYFSKFRLSHFSRPDGSASVALLRQYVYKSQHKDSIVILGPGWESLLQVSTEQGLLLDPGSQALTKVTYSHKSVIQVEEILNSVYGASLKNPDDRPRMEDAQDIGGIQNLWEKRTPAEWLAFRQKYHATAVLAWTSWKVQLPVFAEKDGQTLFLLQ